jgi:hypothetical protein
VREDVSTHRVQRVLCILLDLEATYPLLDEAFREGWEAPGMADYDRYDELKPQ